MENTENKKNKRRLIAGFAVLAAVAVIAVTNVAGLWTSTATVGAGTAQTFTTGGLSIAPAATNPLSIKLYAGGAPTTVVDTATTVTAANAWRLVPGDKVEVEAQYDVKALGHNLKVGVAMSGATALTDTTSNTTSVFALSTPTIDLVAGSSNLIAATTVAGLGTAATTGAVANIGALSTVGDAAATGVITVKYTITFENDGTGATANEGNSYTTADTEIGTAGTRSFVATLADTISGVKLTQVL
ncbi:hypothetical protein FACS1894125_3740 [Actinomycetota bacterium]|nr:hypothetical protein FACS1894125_3740 [Actinomycetota bacterium]